MRRFYLPQTSLQGEEVNISGEEARHMAQVLRLNPGTVVELFDGAGNIFRAQLVRVDRGQVCARILERLQVERLSTPPLVLAQALLKGKKMELVVQKATELGVHTLLPIISARCQAQELRGQQQERWLRIMLEACKQCKRPLPMSIGAPMPLEQVDFSGYALRLAAWEDEAFQALPAQQLPPRAGSVCLLLGPEGGLDTQDLARLSAQNFLFFSLGPLILRAETAAISAVALVQYLSGALRPQI